MKKSHNTPYLLFIALFCLIGLGMVIGGVFIVKNNNQKLKTYTHTLAEVVDYKVSEHWDDDGFTSYTYAEIVEYTVGEQKYYATNPISTNAGFKKIGSYIEIAYNPDNPSDCVFVTKSNKFAYGMLIGIGALFFLVSCAMLFFYIRGRRSERYNAEVYTADTENFT